MKKAGLFFFAWLLITLSYAKVSGENPLKVYEIKASETDKNIQKEYNAHFCYYNSEVQSRKTLVLHLVGTIDSPRSTQLFPTMAANNGFHVIALKYKNEISAKAACKDSDDPNGYENFRREIIDGHDYSAFVNVDSSNCINNRLLKLLQYLHKKNPKQGWNNYFSDNTILWANIIVSGHSQGGGHAAVIAQYNKVKRVLMFAAPNDYSDYFSKHAKWTYRAHLTPASDYYAFGNVNDRLVDFSIQNQEWDNLGLKAFGDTLNMDKKRIVERESHKFYTKQSVFGMVGNHSVMIVDRFLFLNENKQPVFQDTWKRMLGIE